MKSRENRKRYWQEQLKTFYRSGLSQREYCRQADIGYWSFNQWKRRIESQQESPAMTELQCKPANQDNIVDNKIVINVNNSIQIPLLGSIASPGLSSYSIIAKFCDALPFYRQAKIYSRFGVDISRATLCNWSLLTAEKCMRLLEVLEETILSGSVIRMDETSVQVLHEQGRKAETKSYMQVAGASSLR